MNRWVDEENKVEGELQWRRMRGREHKRNLVPIVHCEHINFVLVVEGRLEVDVAVPDHAEAVHVEADVEERQAAEEELQ